MPKLILNCLWTHQTKDIPWHNSHRAEVIQIHCEEWNGKGHVGMINGSSEQRRDFLCFL